MRYFIFRNNTIESFFDSKDIEFSGYGDISCIPQDADSYIWFYQVPVTLDSHALCEEIDSFFPKLELACQKIPSNKNIFVFTLVDRMRFNPIQPDISQTEKISGFNSKLYGFADRHPNVKIIDFSSFTSKYAEDELFDWKYYFISQTLLNPKLIKPFKEWFENKEKSIALKRKKCIVLDLDNTLWKGILGEDGIDGIRMDGNYPGKAFHFFQAFLLELNKTGVILTLCSKNNLNDVKELWEKNPFLLIKENHIAAYRINWNNKADNITELSKELNIGLDSMVFVDDNPTERELIRQMLPMVEVPEFPDKPYHIPSFCKNVLLPYFTVYSITAEDKDKTKQYKANAQREEEKSKFSDFHDYLKSLHIELTIEEASSFNIPRIAQMTQKTNQFNLTTRRYTDSDVETFLTDGWKIYCLSVKDKFGDNGITGTIFFQPEEDNLYAIDTLLLSCRILGKGIETAFLLTALNLLFRGNVKGFISTYLKTNKNSQVEEFYDKCGFTLVKDNGTTKEYTLNMSAPFKINDIYTINTI